MNRIYLNDGWQFLPEYKECLLKDNLDELTQSQICDIRIPHTVKEVPFDYFDESEYQMISGYRKKMFAPKEWDGKLINLTFEGVAHQATVYVNGQFAYCHKCGYTAFTINITKMLKYGSDNIITVKVDSNETLNVPPFGYVIDYMTFGGIYRDVYVEISNSNTILDVFPIILLEDSDLLNPDLINKEESREGFTGKRVKKAVVRTKIGLSKSLIDNLHQNKNIRITHTLSNKYDEFETKWDVSLLDDCAEGNHEVENVFLWDIEHPNLYELETTLFIDDKRIESRIERIGFRKTQFKQDGFYLNAKKIKIRGMNRHQSYPYVGYAMPKSMQELDADILKYELGLNAVRTSHYPQSQYFINRCDEIGLLVFTEMPGWQHIGDEEWKLQAIENTKEMVLQYRNHPSIFLWGVRINESPDDDEFYVRTNEVARKLDPTRSTAGVRCFKKSNLLEDVYTYNDFVHSGDNMGCEKKSKVTSDISKAYLVSEYNGHMYPTKTFDSEEHQSSHMLRHARVLNDIQLEEDIAGSFGWCMFDYNTHKDFGSGDRICYHGIMDMFRNPKMAALIYACQQEKNIVLDISSSMDIGEHPGCNRGKTYILSNADYVRMYKNGDLIKEYNCRKDSEFKGLKYGPIVIDDFIGDKIGKNEPTFSKKKVRDIKYALNYTAINGYGKFTPKLCWIAFKALTIYRMKMSDAVKLFNKYIGDWGQTSTVYKFEAIKDGKVVKTITKAPMTKVFIKAKVSKDVLVEKNSYDVVEVRLMASDEYGNRLPFFNEGVVLGSYGPIEIIGPNITAFRGGYLGVYVKSKSEAGKATLTVTPSLGNKLSLNFEVKI
ncbi:glycoside hydrolase family 2 protein [Lachnobacterium bovis]|uniref:glycoside hydrolase family 2 protein n=1 Tax=Lachnobacterium bovis TaxID=140626 RepID=UPI0003B4A9EB|nr:glycoside hydrolase family 2 TIM barrel-domain containing protein [Lachnobacterium bovis]